MKKLILAAALMTSLQQATYAQTEPTPYIRMISRSKTDQTFNIWDGLINIRDFVVLKEGRLILELSGEDDYAGFRNMDSLLTVFRKDIAFYKDSLSANPTGNVRIDYVLNEEYSFKKIRIKKYNAEGSSFLNRDGEISKLKFEQDTVRIIVQKSKPGLGRGKNGPCSIAYSVQATFILGNYYDIDKVIADKALNHIIDTLEKSSQPKRKRRYNFNRVSITYNPYYNGPAGQLKRHNFLMSNEYSSMDNRKKNRIGFNPQFGAGIIRNTLAPVTDIGLQYNSYWNDFRERNIYRLSGTGYYFFDKDSKGDFVVNDNWFINLTAGSISDRVDPGWYGRETTFGVGYLLSPKGGYFKNTTMRVFTDISFIRGISIVPEIIFTDNFKQVFPGITIKVFQ